MGPPTWAATFPYGVPGTDADGDGTVDPGKSADGARLFGGARADWAATGSPHWRGRSLAGASTALGTVEHRRCDRGCRRSDAARRPPSARRASRWGCWGRRGTGSVDDGRQRDSGRRDRSVVPVDACSAGRHLPCHDVRMGVTTAAMGAPAAEDLGVVFMSPQTAATFAGDLRRRGLACCCAVNRQVGGSAVMYVQIAPVALGSRPRRSTASLTARWDPVANVAAVGVRALPPTGIVDPATQPCLGPGAEPADVYINHQHDDVRRRH